MRYPTLLLLLTLSLASCAPIYHRKISARVLVVSGKVEGSFNGHNFGLTKSSWLEEGTTIACYDNGHADLMLLPGILIELEPNSELTLQRLRLSRDGDETIHPMVARAATIRFQRGTLFASVGQAQTRSRLLIETPAGQVSADPQRAFKLIAHDTELWLLSARGNVNFTGRDGEEKVIVSAGQFADLPADKSAQRAAGAGREIQAQVPEILAVQRRLLELAKAAAPPFLPWKTGAKKN